MKKLFSLSTLVEAARHCLRRFPVTVAYISLLSFYLLLTAWTDGKLFPVRVNDTICYYLAVGILLTTVLQLWGEDVRYKRRLFAVNALSHIALIADAIYLYCIYTHFNMEIWLAHAAVILALVLCMFILPFMHEKDDISSWNFALRLLFNGCTSWVTGGIMCGGLCLLTLAVDELFGIKLSDNWYATWGILFGWTLPSLLFVGRIPADREKFDSTPRISPFLNKSIRYLFLPLLGCYLLVLYGYLAKIIIEWQLPDGWVSKLVSVLMFGNIAVVLGLYPSFRKTTSERFNRVVRILPLVILPLLVLMSLGIVRRLSDYGVTVNRLYLLVLNVWFYVVCVGLYLNKNRRIWWISASFALFFLLTSVLPCNISRFTRNWIYEHVESTIKSNYKGKLPMSEGAYFDWLGTLPVNKATTLNSRLKYFYQELNDKTKPALVSDSVNWWRAENYIKSKHNHKEFDDCIYLTAKSAEDGQEIKLGGVYSSMIVYTNTDITLSRDKSHTLQVILQKDGMPIDTLLINTDELRRWSAMSRYRPQNITCRKKGNRFVLTHLTLNRSSGSHAYNFTYSGFYLIK